MATTYQMSKGSSKSHKSLEPTKEQAKNYVDKPKKVPYKSLLAIKLEVDAKMEKRKKAWSKDWAGE